MRTTANKTGSNRPIRREIRAKKVTGRMAGVLKADKITVTKGERVYVKGLNWRSAKPASNAQMDAFEECFKKYPNAMNALAK